MAIIGNPRIFHKKSKFIVEIGDIGHARLQKCSALTSRSRTTSTSSGLGLTYVNFKRNLDIVQQDRAGTTLRRWSLPSNWPVKFVAGDWDNEAEENVIESVSLAFDFFELVQPRGQEKAVLGSRTAGLHETQIPVKGRH